MAEIELKRPSGYRVDRRRAYRVLIDGRKVGKIASGESKAFDVQPGRHELQLKIDWGSSEKLQVDVGDDGQAAFVCGPRITDNDVSLKVGLRGMYWATLGRGRYIDLRQAQ